MPRLTKFQDDWLELQDCSLNKVSLWCSKGHDEFHCLCRFCNKEISIGNSGKVQLLQHANTAKHKKSIKDATDSTQVKLTTLTTASGQLGLCLRKNVPPSPSDSYVHWNMNEKEKVICNEILWTLHVAVTNSSFSSCDFLSGLFARMFSNCEEAKGMKLASRKLSYEISHGLGPYFLSKLSTAVQNCFFFTLMYDESLNDSNKKQIDFHVRFWNNDSNLIQQSYVTTKILYHATAVMIDSAIMECLEECKFPLRKLIMLGSDGPNVNKSVFKIMDQRVQRATGQGLINIGTCNLHIVHNAFGEGLQIEVFASVIEFLEDIDIWFRKYPSRQEDLFLASEDDEMCNPLRYVSNRWLSIIPVCTRILKIYTALVQYFLTDLVNKKSPLIKSSRYKRIHAMLKNEMTTAYLHFLISVGNVFEHFLRLLQSEKTLVHVLYDEMSSLVKKLLFRFVNMDSYKSTEGEDLLTIPLKDLPSKDNLKYVDVGIKTNEALMSVDSVKKRCFKIDAQNFYITVTSYLIEKLPFKNKLLKCLQVLHPAARKEDVNVTTLAVKRISKMLSRCIQEEDFDKIIDEWKIYVCDDDIIEEWYLENNSAEDVSKWKNIDVYWKKVFELETNGRKRYPHLAQLVKVSLCLSHGQAPVERGFSISKRMMRDRPTMNLSSMVGLRLIKDSVPKETVHETQITKEMIKYYCDAHSKYKAELKEKEKKEGESKPFNAKEPVKTPLDNLNKLKDSVDAAQKLLDEGNKRLEMALKRKSFEDIAAAQALIAAGNKKLKNSK